MIPIDDNEAFKIRANAGEGETCDVNPIQPRPLATPLPPDIPCDDPPEPDVETFFSPTPAPTPVRQPRLPGAIKIHSPELPIGCPPGTTTESEPDTVVLPFSAITRTINFTDILGDSGEPLFDQTTLYNLYNVAGTIRSAVYDYLGPSAPTQNPERSTYIKDNFESKVADVVSITKLPSAIVTQFWKHILAQQETLDATARSLADRKLDCGFFNEPLWIICYDQEAGEYRISYAPPYAEGAVFVPAGVAFSNVDQATANSLAIQAADNVPVCQFENQALDVSCEELFGGDFSDSVLFEWPTLQSPKTTKISDIGGHVVLDKTGGVLPRTKGYEALIYAEVAVKGTAATKRELVLKVSVPVGLATGNTQDEADAKARAIALSYLDCFIPSRRQAAKCTDLEVSEPAYTQAQSSSDNQVLSEIVTGYTTLAHLLPIIKPDNVTIINSPSGPIIDTRAAVRLHVPEGAFVADTRQSADTEAAAFALSNAATTLECNWANRRVIYACDDKAELIDATNHLDDPLFLSHGVDGKTYDGPFEIDLKRGQIVDIQYLGTTELMAIVDKSDPYFVTVERQEFESSTSQADADRIATAHAISLLNCVYCNPRIEPNCPPDDYNPFEPLPLSPGGNDYSFDATRGVPGIPYYYDESATPPRWRIIDEQGKVPQGPIETEAWVCSTDPVDVARVAGDDGGTALRTLDTSLECRFCNDQVNAACCSSSETDDETYVRFGPEQCVQLANAFDNFTVGECAGNQISDPFVKVVIPACSMFAESKEAANDLALNVAMAQLNCLFANESYEAICEPACDNSAGGSFTVTVGGNTYTGTHAGPVFVGTETAEVPPGIYRSSCSQEQANAQAKELGDAQLVCLWTNNTQTAKCPTPEDGATYHSTAVTTATIPEGTIVTDQCTPYANEIALRTAATQLFCAFTNETQIENDCPPGYKLISEGVVEADTIVALSMEAANAIANGIAKASRVCEQEFFGNEYRIDDTCPSGSSGGIVGCENGSGGQIEYRLVEAGVVEPNTVFALTQAKANSIAESLATSSKICEQVFYANNPQYDDTCPPGYELKEKGEVDACVVVAPKQEIADAIAEGIAKSSKVCEQIFYDNDPQYDDQCPSGGSSGDECSGSGGGQIEYRLVEAGVVEAGTIVALTKERANAVAKGIAKASKICEQVFYGNDPKSDETCPDGYRLVEAGEVDICAVVGPTKAIANKVAEGIAKASKVCEQIFYENTPQYDDKCPSGSGSSGGGDGECGGGGGGGGGGIEYRLVEAGFVEAGVILALTQERADAIAKGLAKASKVCEQVFYGNEYKEDRDCPAKHELIEPGVILPCTVLAPTKAIANKVAEGIAKAAKICALKFYENNYQEDKNCPLRYKLIEAGVVQTGEVLAITQEKADQIARGIAKAIKICELVFYDNYRQSASTCPPKFRLVEAGVVEAGQISALDQDKADKIAKGIAEALKICELILYGNDRQEDCSCPGKPPESGDQCNGGSSGIEYRCVQPGIVEEDEILAPTKEQANKIAIGIAKATKICEPIFHGNDPQIEDKCPKGFKLVEAGQVDACAVVAPSKATANKIAQGIAKASKVCELELHGNDYQSYGACPNGFDLEEPGVVQAGEIETPKKEISNSIARSIAKATVSCTLRMCCNLEWTFADCPPGFELVTKGFVPACSFELPTCAAANAIAKAIAQSSIVCKLKLVGNSTQTNSSCPSTGDWELIASGVVFDGEIKTNDKAASDAVALGLAKARTYCRPKLYGNNEAYIPNCPDPQEKWEFWASGFCQANTVFAYSQEAADRLAQGIARATLDCRKKRWMNYEAEGYAPECEENEEPIQHKVPSDSIPSWHSQDDANQIAQGIADSLTYCKPNTKTYTNTSDAEGVLECQEGEEAQEHTVPAGSIPSWVSAADADSIASGIAQALSFCKPEKPPEPPGGGVFVYASVDGARQWYPVNKSVTICEDGYEKTGKMLFIED